MPMPPKDEFGEHIRPVRLFSVDGKAVPRGGEYKVVAAGATAATLGAAGAIGDWLSHVVFQPQTTMPGACQILDGAVVVYDLPAGTLVELRPIIIPQNAYSASGAWKITTGANMKATGYGDFT